MPSFTDNAWSPYVAGVMIGLLRISGGHGLSGVAQRAVGSTVAVATFAGGSAMALSSLRRLWSSTSPWGAVTVVHSVVSRRSP